MDDVVSIREYCNIIMSKYFFRYLTGMIILFLGFF